MLSKIIKDKVIIITAVLLFVSCLTPTINSSFNKKNSDNISENFNLFTEQNSILIAYWAFDEGVGSVANDSSGHNLSGTIYGPAWTTGYSNYGLSFDGNDDYVSLDDHAQELALNKTDYYKVTAWFKTQANYQGTIFMISDDDGLPYLYIKVKNNGTVEMRVQCTSSTEIRISSAEKFNDGQWHFVEGIFRGSNGYPDIELYVDYQLVASGSGWLCSMFYHQFNKAKIGMASFDAIDNYGGVIDEVKIYKRLDENEKPNPPQITGPTSGTIGVTYDYNFSMTDPEGDEMFLWVDWGDNISTHWIGPFDSGDSVVLNHSWSENIVYEIKAKLRDIFEVGEWGSFVVAMGNTEPSKPIIQGPIIGGKGIQHEYKFKSIDPEGHDVKYSIDWGDGEQEWTDFHNSAEEVIVNHTFSSPGVYLVKADAFDIYDAESGWSEELSINITEKALIVGLIANNITNGDFIEFNARILLYMGLEPFNRKMYLSGEKIKVAKQFTGNLNGNFIFGIFNSIVLGN